MARITTPRQRAALAPRSEPYWHSLGTGRHVGYRRTATGGAWIARHYDRDTRKRQYSALGAFESYPEAEHYALAAKAATAWFERLQAGLSARANATVAMAWQEYTAHAVAKAETPQKAEAVERELQARYRRTVAGQAIEHVPLERLRRSQLQAWRQERTDRDAVLMRAVLNYAHADGLVNNTVAWGGGVLAPQSKPQRRTNYLTREQRQALIAAMEPGDTRAFVTVLAQLPIRVGALARATVADYDRDTARLTITRDKAGAGRTIPVPPQVAKVLNQQAQGKTPAAPLVANADGRPLQRHQWSRAINKAVAVAGLPPQTVAYDLRHSAITDLLAGGGLTPIEVAQLAGTSLRMLEQHYLQERPGAYTNALEALAL